MQTQAFYMRYMQPMEKYSLHRIPGFRNSYRRLTQAEIILRIAAHIDGETSNGMQIALLWHEACAIALGLNGKSHEATLIIISAYLSQNRKH